MISICLWFDGRAEEAATFYTSLFSESEIHSVGRYGEGSPFPAGTAMMVEFSLLGRRFQALNGGPQFQFTEAISLSVPCGDQAEVDRLWEALTDGGSPGQCGWLKDRFGVSWQLVPKALGELQKKGDGAAKARMWKALMGMGKIDVAELERAHRG